MATRIELPNEHVKRLMNVALQQRKRAAKKYEEMYGAGSDKIMRDEMKQIEIAILNLQEIK